MVSVSCKRKCMTRTNGTYFEWDIHGQALDMVNAVKAQNIIAGLKQ